MPYNYPFNFTLDDGVAVTVNKTGNNTYDFTLKSEEGTERQFSFTDDRPRNELIESLDFDELNAVRRFWLEQEDI